MKIGILTFHCAHNYGAVLQCYATQEFLRSKGYDVEIINYRPKYLLDPYKRFNIKRIISKNPIRIIKNVIKELIVLSIRIKRWRGFEEFINTNLILSNKVTKESIPDNYDIYIVGSDQIWNPQITRGFDRTYFCKFPFVKGNKRYIAYAASMEAKTLDNNAIEHYRDNLRHFDAISVRENKLLDLLQPLIDKPVVQVLDPTLMISPQIWDKIQSDNDEEDKYVAVYQVRNNVNTIRIAYHIANQIGAKVKILVASPQINMKDTEQTATPEDFVSTIRSAACVVTTSFHGSAFSVIFNRPFYTIKLNDGADSRSSSLLDSLDLKDRMIGINDLPTFTLIDYTNVNNKLNILRENSQCFLREILNDNIN